MPPDQQQPIVADLSGQPVAGRLQTLLRKVWAMPAGKAAIALLFVFIAGGIFAATQAIRQDNAPTGTPEGSPYADASQREDEGSLSVPESTETPTDQPADEESAPANNPQGNNGNGGGGGPTGGNGNTGGESSENGSGGGGDGGGNGGGGGPQYNCINVPSACGYPDATNTGVPAGITLTNSGSINVFVDGTVIQNLNINGQIFIRANNVTIRNVRITSGDWYPIDYDGHTGLLIEDTEIIGTSTAVTACVSFRNYTVRRVNCSGGADGFKADSNVLVEDSYVHNLRVTMTSHNDGVQTTGGSNVTLRHNTFKLGNQSGISAVIQIGTEWGANTNWLVENNLMDGGGWTINCGGGNSNLQFNNNRFTRRHGYGIGWCAGTSWSNNYYDDNGEEI